MDYLARLQGSQAGPSLQPCAPARGLEFRGSGFEFRLGRGVEFQGRVLVPEIGVGIPGNGQGRVSYGDGGA